MSSRYNRFSMSEPLQRIRPITRDSVEDRVALALRALITTGELPEGTPLVQRDLAQRLGVSQTPVRLGLTELVRSGLVELGESGRASVSRLTREDLEEIYAARLGLEGLAARLGAAAVGREELNRMSDMLAELGRLAKQRDVTSYLQVRWDLHETAYAAARRPRLLAEVERLYWRAERYTRLIYTSGSRFRESLGHYRRFYEACRAHDPLQAEHVMQNSMRWGVELIGATVPTEAEWDSSASKRAI